ncbi:sensor histidine kinase [Aureibacter tunicatorum]|uniref:LytS/YehU family sensor histidine kinase n=1 Tax=Aureibacter tunicatorum TaxID=866807 RepID=A0AAE4BTZ4_9BACT|nr:histidine kinase [Aureibacter tunicatorum]MDR6240283.1 LytS/YehU family sensor histidine kinase [Aureibacter tunicatorum]BDD05836.1 sensor histidine kinase [Aureibacter tunicatorum]
MKVFLHFVFWIVIISLRFFSLVERGGFGKVFVVVAVFYIQYITIFYATIFVQHYFLKSGFLQKVKYFIALLTVLLVGVLCLKFTVISLMKIGIMKLPVYVPSLVFFRVVFFMLFALLFDYVNEKSKAKEAEKNAKIEKQETELMFLKNQMNPHFFFNTLNNLYGLVYRKDDNAPEVLLMLSESMRYIIYKTQNEWVPLKGEIEFMKNYFELEKLRLKNSNNTKFILNNESEYSHMEIAPLLLLPMLENCFKHSDIDSNKDSFINIHLMVDNGVLYAEFINTFDKQRKVSKPGIGLDNLRKRLAIQCKDNYNVKTVVEGNIYKVVIEIRLKIV